MSCTKGRHDDLLIHAVFPCDAGALQHVPHVLEVQAQPGKSARVGRSGIFGRSGLSPRFFRAAHRKAYTGQANGATTTSPTLR
jgi:hypothetical protein